MALLEWQPIDLRTDVDDPEYRGDPADLVEAAGLLLELAHRPSWHAQAACRGQGPAVWFPGQGEPVTAGCEVCAGCPVRAECLTAALDVGTKHDYGIWGGTSVRQRRQLRRTAPPQTAA